MKKIGLFFLAVLFSAVLVAQNADSAWFVNNYSKKEVYISMRDGVKLFTSFYIPKDKSEKHPFLITRTPYSCHPYGETNYIQLWHSYKMAYAREQFILVFQDVRGRYMSEGEFEDVRPFIAGKKNKTDIDEASDTYDSMEWMLKNIDNNNGHAGVMGISYPGFYATEAALSNHPAIKAVSPQAPVTDWFVGDDFHHNGAFFAMDGFSFYSSFGKPHHGPMKDYGSGYESSIKDKYSFFLNAGNTKNLARMIGDSIRFWHEMYKHPNYDEWWKVRNARVGLYNVKPAMLWVGGLFDAEDCWGAWNSYKACEKQSPATQSSIVMGPWSHGQWSKTGFHLGNIRFGNNTAEWYQQQLEIPFFLFHLKNKGSISQIAEANIFFSGANEWKTFNQWPPANISYERMVIDKNKKLHFTRDSVVEYPMFHEYLSDPEHPVPYNEGVHEHRTTEYMTDDQRFASQRPDVLTYVMDPLAADITLAGPVIANLVTSITGTDADFIVKLIDVFPDTFEYPASMKGNGKDYPMGGYQMLVRAEIMRGKFRDDLSNPTPFKPNTVTQVKIELPDVAHTFKKGHRIMVQVQSTWFPLVDRNPQYFTDIYNDGNIEYKKEWIRIYYGNLETTFSLPILKK